MKNNKGAALLELVVSIGFLSIILINAFIITNTVLNKNSLLYSDQIERKTINTIYVKIAQDLYKYNIDSFTCDSNNCDFTYYTNSSNSEKVKNLKITNEGLEYDNEKINNNSAMNFNSIDVVTDNNILTLTITYNDNQKLKIYSINYKGEE